MKVQDVKRYFQDIFCDIKKNTVNGGNATVYFGKNKTNKEDIALKILSPNINDFKNKKKRFIAEIQIIRNLEGTDLDIIPIYDSYNSTGLEKYFWYSMPVAIPIVKYFDSKNSTFEEIVLSVCMISYTLINLHAKGIYHRDIKPDNIYYYNKRYCLADFGLVDFPNKENITKTGERVGAKSTIAPEMTGSVKKTYGEKADVYSLSKTLWMLLMHEKFSFDGVFNPTVVKLSLSSKYGENNFIELNELLVDSTQIDPNLRPTMIDFGIRLIKYLGIYKDFSKKNLSSWRYSQSNLVYSCPPDTVIWTKIDDIILVLNNICTSAGLNHVFLPGGGGLDLDEVKKAREDGCILLKLNSLNYILKPKRLISENIGNNGLFSYFRLETQALNNKQLKNEDRYYEEVVEDLSGNDVSKNCGYSSKYKYGEEIPNNYINIVRILKGDLVIFSKVSIYNQLTSTYDGRHCLFSSESFRQYMIDMYNDMGRVTRKEFEIAEWRKKYSKNPFVAEPYEPIDLEALKEQYIQLQNFIDEDIIAKDYSYLLNKSAIIGDENTIHYGITFQLDDLKDILNPDSLWGYQLNKNGQFFSRTLFEKIKEPFRFGNFQDVKDFKDCIDSKIDKFCIANNFKKPLFFYSFSLEIMWNKKPKHQFTGDEINSVLLSGDDQINNTLVINKDGYAQLVNNKEWLINQYPVKHDCFIANNNYVGESFKPMDPKVYYISSLEGLLESLKTDEQVFVDSIGTEDENKLIAEIKNFKISVKK